MSNRVTLSNLEAIVSRINRIAGTPEKPYLRDESGNLVGQVGNFHLSEAYGGVALYKMTSAGGAVNDVFRVGHVSKRELQALMFAFIEGIGFATDNLKSAQ